MSTPASKQPSPQLFFQTINAHQQTEALKAAIELEIFTAIGEGNTSAAAIAQTLWRVGARHAHSLRLSHDYGNGHEGEQRLWLNARLFGFSR